MFIIDPKYCFRFIANTIEFQCLGIIGPNVVFIIWVNIFPIQSAIGSEEYPSPQNHRSLAVEIEFGMIG